MDFSEIMFWNIIWYSNDVDVMKNHCRLYLNTLRVKTKEIMKDRALKINIL